MRLVVCGTSMPWVQRYALAIIGRVGHILEGGEIGLILEGGSHGCTVEYSSGEKFRKIHVGEIQHRNEKKSGRLRNGRFGTWHI